MGILDGPVRGAVSTVFSVLTENTFELRRRVESYDPASGFQAVGSASGYAVSGSHLAGATTLTVAGGSGAFAVGDEIEIGSNPIRYRVSVASATPAATVQIDDGLRVALSGGEAVAVLATESRASVKGSPPESYTAREIASTEIQAGDLKIHVAAKDLDDAGFGDPQPGDLISFGARTWRVVSVAMVWSGDQVALYTLQVRR